MAFPNFESTPSEATVANICNQELIRCLGDPHSWVLVPSNWEEATLGYDASLPGMKAAPIQYKSITPLERGIASCAINPSQHRVLVSQLAGNRRSEAFFAFSLSESYRNLGRRHRRGETLGSFVFVDVLDVPVGSTRLSLRSTSDLRAYKKNQPSQVPRFQFGPNWCKKFKGCEIGRKLFTEQDADEFLQLDGSPGRVNVFVSSV